jgi:hypothetical protein
VPAIKVGPSELKAGQRGICSHKDVSDAWHQSDHWDPGTGFPWTNFMALVTGGDIAPEEDDVADNDVVGEIAVSARAYYQLERAGGVRVVGQDREPIDNEPFHPYYILGNDGCVYRFGPELNHGAFSYPGLPADARQGNRYFVAIRPDVSARVG